MEEQRIAERLRDIVLPHVPDEDIDYFEAASMDEDWSDLIELALAAARAYEIPIPAELIAA